MKKQHSPQQKVTRTDIKIKYVRKAGMWCTTYWKDGKQIQQWTNQKTQKTPPQKKIKHNSVIKHNKKVFYIFPIRK